MKSFDRYSNYKTLQQGAINKNKSNIVDEMRNTFELHKNEIPTSVLLPICPPHKFPILDEMSMEEIIVDDILINDSRAGDEKLVKTSKDSTLDVGGYFYMDDYFWLIKHKDSRVMPTMKSFTARRCNQYIKYKYNDVVVSIPVSIEYMTMYTDGLQNVKFGTVQDSKRTIWMGYNDVSVLVDIGTRVVISDGVFEITQINDYEINGLGTGTKGIIKCLAVQVPKISTDKMNEGLGGDTDVKDTSDEIINTIIGDYYIYTVEESEYKGTLVVQADHWVCDNEDVVFIENNADKCIITIPRDKCERNIGKTIKLSRVDVNGNVVTSRDSIGMPRKCEREIKVRGV